MRIPSILLPLALTTGLFMACGDKDGNTDSGSIGDDGTDTTDTDGTDTDTDTDGTDTDTDGTDTDTTGPVDEDGDGYPADEDCDDTNPAVNPGATEVCNDIDDDCDDLVDDQDDDLDLATGSVFYGDADADGFGADDAEIQACVQPEGSATVGGDCDDGDAAINPDATEVCDEIDNDCDDLIDDADDSVDGTTFSEFWIDADGDGFGDAASDAIGACAVPDGAVDNALDCNDDDDAINPDATEICDDADVDEDCNELADDDDAGVDTSTMITVYPDADGDGFGDMDDAGWTECDADEGETTDHSDCNDGDGDINPDATEVCDDADVDEDCNELADNADDGADESTMITVYPDVDDDGFGDIHDEGWLACDAEAYETTDHSDCNDDDEYSYPGADEIDDLYDNDCDSLCDEGFIAEGDLVISEFLADPAAVSDSEGEWLEITNVSGAEIAICGGWNLSDDGADDHDIDIAPDEAIILADGEAAVFGRNADSAVNGGVTVDYAYGSAYPLANGNDEIILSFDGYLIDEVWYDFDGDWSDMDAAGYSATLNDFWLDAEDNDDPAAWCLGASTFGSGDHGTPGASNEDECPSTCGDGTIELDEEYDPAPGPFSAVFVDEHTCRWDFSDVNQLYCNGGCSWAGGGGCDDADADILCKLITGNPDSEAISWTATTALAEPGFPCTPLGLGTAIDVVDRGVSVDVSWQDSSILANHGAGDVVAYPDCTDP
ncbi:MAG: lamin tail domain-containing protein [Alphaproteobacteria bacterium]|nr:lamin tail domain-containing protein [Alphaproteobacteria bacterium]